MFAKKLAIDSYICKQCNRMGTTIVSSQYGICCYCNKSITLPNEEFTDFTKEQCTSIYFGKVITTTIKSFYNRDIANRSQSTIFVFGDNLVKKGTGGQACIRYTENSYGIPTKRSPSNSPNAFFADRRDEEEAVLKSLRRLYKMGKETRSTIIFPNKGLGTGLAKMEKTSPILFQKMCSIIVEHFGIEEYKKFIK